MARATGRDVIVTLMESVQELHRNQTQATEHLEAMLRLSKDSAKRLEQMARTLGGLAKVLRDHEERLVRLEDRADV